MPDNQLSEVLGDEQVVLFDREMAKFCQQFFDAMVDGIDATIKLEVKCDKGSLQHVRADGIRFSRPAKYTPTGTAEIRAPS